MSGGRRLVRRRGRRLRGINDDGVGGDDEVGWVVDILCDESFVDFHGLRKPPKGHECDASVSGEAQDFGVRPLFSPFHLLSRRDTRRAMEHTLNAVDLPRNSKGRSLVSGPVHRRYVSFPQQRKVSPS